MAFHFAYLSSAVAAVFISLVAFNAFNHVAKEQNLPLYNYQPLKHNRSIRLFTLLPAWNPNTPIRGYLTEVDLDSRPAYEGLSYLCGDLVPGHEIDILSSTTHDTKELSRLPIYPNCLAALRVLRYRLTSRQLWVDAISIDQSPTAEKSQQVKMMTEIYEKAQRVLIVLKPDVADESKVWQAALLFRVIGWLYRLRLLRVYDQDEQADMRMPKATRVVMACDKYVELYSKKLGDAFNAPFLNRYFKRVWTVQEIAMAHQILVHYGSSTVSWQDFVVSGLFAAKKGGFAKNQESAVDVFRDSTVHWDLLNGLESHFVLPDIYSLETLNSHYQSRNLLQRYTPGMSELALIKSKGLQAFEPKDKAYAMLWAFADVDGNLGTLFNVDYRKPVEQVYTEFSIAIFVKSKGSSLQFYLVNSNPRNDKLPSWVPDWSGSSPMSLFVWTERLRYGNAAGYSSRRYHISIEGSVLRISGFKHSEMKAFIRLSKTSRGRNVSNGDARELIEALIDAAELMRSLIDIGKSHTFYESEEVLLEAVHRVINSQKTLHDSRADDQLEFHATQYEIEISNKQVISVGLLRVRIFDELSFLLDEKIIPLEQTHNILQRLLSAEQVNKVLSEASSLSSLSPFIAVITPLSDYYNLWYFLHTIVLDHQDKDLFITDEGVIGMAFQGLNGGDFVALWNGCPSPLIVRQVSEAEENDSKIYQLHGPAFVDGLMDGEGWPDDEGKLIEFIVV